MDHLIPIKTPFKVGEVIRETRPDLLHINHVFMPVSIAASLYAAKRKVPYIATNHSLPPVGGVEHWAPTSPMSPYRWIVRPIIGTAVSGAAARFAETFIGWRDVQVIPNMVDVGRFSRIGGDVPLREDYFVFIGRLVWRKGVHVLLSAVRQLSRNGKPPRVLIIGEGYLEGYLKAISSDMGNVLFLGKIEEPKKIDIIKRSKALILPSISGESFGVVLIEAFAAGTPVIATRVGGIPEVVDHGVNGLLVEPGKPHQLAEAMRELSSSDEMWKSFSLNARRKAVERYSVEVVGRMYEEVYLEALASHTARPTISMHL